MLNEAETLAPGQTFTPRQYRILKASVIIMGVLLVIGLALLVIGISLRASKLGKTPAKLPAVAAGNGLPPTLPIAVEAGTELADVLADQGRLILHLKRAGESEFAVIDLATGRETRFKLDPRH
jgi:hypothetical protein